MIEIKPIDSNYVEKIAEMEKLCFSNPWSEQTLTSEMNDENARFFGAFVDGELGGYIGGRTVAEETEIFNVATKPEYRRMGLGKALIEEFVSASKKQNTNVIFLEVRTSNLSAINLYEKAGFVFCGLRKNYYTNPTENAILMRLAFDGTMEYEDDD